MTNYDIAKLRQTHEDSARILELIQRERNSLDNFEVIGEQCRHQIEICEASITRLWDRYRRLNPEHDQFITGSEPDYELRICEKCIQMTNHLEGICQKCKSNDR